MVSCLGLRVVTKARNNPCFFVHLPNFGGDLGKTYPKFIPRLVYKSLLSCYPNRVKDSRRIVICGASIYMLAIESGLSAMVEGDVVRIDPYLPNTVERISSLEPRAIIIELDGKNNELVLEDLAQSIPLIVLDEARCSIKVLAREHVPIAEISELTDVIEKIIQQQDVLLGENITQP